LHHQACHRLRRCRRGLQQQQQQLDRLAQEQQQQQGRLVQGLHAQQQLLLLGLRHVLLQLQQQVLVKVTTLTLRFMLRALTSNWSVSWQWQAC
jgi:NADH:ubiquinone oxidoreductase subunit F (NADH-binding)